MDQSLARPPHGVTLNALSHRVFVVLSKYTAFPWPILKTQAARLGLDGEALQESDLARLIERLGRGVARFNSPEAGEDVSRELWTLIEFESGS